MMWINLGLVAVIVIILSLISGGSWGVYKMACDTGIILSFAIIGVTGTIASIALMLWGSHSAKGRGRSKIKNPVVSTISVFAILLVSICLFEGLLYDIYMLVALFWR